MKDIIRNIIREEIEMLFEAFEMRNEGKKFTPPQNVSQIASEALKAIDMAKNNNVTPVSLDEKNNQGSGRLKAKSLSARTPQNFSEMKRLKAFFESNSSKVEEERRKLGIIQQKKGKVDEMVKSPILLVWNLHGGDACNEWVKNQLSDTHKQGVKKKERLRKVGGATTNNGLGVFQTSFKPNQQRIHR